MGRDPLYPLYLRSACLREAAVVRRLLPPPHPPTHTPPRVCLYAMGFRSCIGPSFLRAPVIVRPCSWHKFDSDLGRRQPQAVGACRKAPWTSDWRPHAHEACPQSWANLKRNWKPTVGPLASYPRVLPLQLLPRSGRPSGSSRVGSQGGPRVPWASRGGSQGASWALFGRVLAECLRG